MLKPSVTRSLLSYSSAMILAQLLIAIQGFLVIRWMQPEPLGLWLGLQIIAIFGVHAHFGILNAVNRQVPFHRGRGDLMRAGHIERVARGNLLILGGVAVIVIGLAKFAGLLEGPRGNGIFALCLATVVNIGVAFYTGLFRSRHEFGRVGSVRLVRAATILTGLPLVYFLGYEGLLVRAVIASLATLFMCLALDGFGVKIEVDWKESRSLIKIGIPILIISYAIVVFSSMDRSLILFHLDDLAMGEFAIAFAAIPMVGLVPGLIGQIYYPRMTESYAASGLSPSLVKTCGRASLASAGCAGIVALAMYALLPSLITTFLPKYEAGLPSLKIALISAFVISFGMGPNYFLISTARKKQQFAVFLLSAGTMAALSFPLSANGLIGIATSVLIGSFIYIIGMWAAVLASLRDRTPPSDRPEAAEEESDQGSPDQIAESL